MKLKTLGKTLILSAALFSPIMMAFDTSQAVDHSNQFFVTANMGYGFNNYTNADFTKVINNAALGVHTNVITSINDSDDIFYTAGFGYMLTKNYGVSVKYLKKDTKPTFNFTGTGGAQGYATMDIHAIIATFLGDFPITNKLSFIGEIGGADIDSKMTFPPASAQLTLINKISSNIVGLLIGAEGDYSITPNLIADVNYQHIFQNNNNVVVNTNTAAGNVGSGLASPTADLFSAGLKYFF